MRIHILGTRGYPSSYGGFETLVRHLAPFLVGRGHQVTVFDRRGARPSDGLAPHTRSVVVDGVRVLRSRGLHGTSSSTLTHGLHSAVVTARERPDVALVLNVANGFFLPALRVARVPVVLNVDGIEWERAKWNAAGKLAFRTGARATARWASVIVADSHSIADRWKRDFHRSSTFIPYGGDDNTPSQPGRLSEIGLTAGSYVLIVARLVPENNVEIMLEGAILSGLPVVVVGSGGDSETEQRIFARHNPPSVRTLGHISDQELLSTLWANCGAYLHGHSVGGTNPALVQAMGLGAPVIAFDTPYSREVLANERQLVPLQPEAIARRLQEVFESGRLRRAIIGSGHQRVSTVYNWRSVCSAYEATLKAATRRTERSDVP